jgi:hypothetical protein
MEFPFGFFCGSVFWVLPHIFFHLWPIYHIEEIIDIVSPHVMEYAMDWLNLHIVAFSACSIWRTSW